MAKPLLATKLFVPPLPARHVARSRLRDRLSAVRDGQVVVVSAPAGFGKTTLINEWLRATGKVSAWVSLDATDDVPSRFARYLLAALKKVHPSLDAKVRDSDDSIHNLSLEEVVALVINTFAGEPVEAAFVLDDYHVITREEVHAGLQLLLDNLPTGLQLILITRTDPPLALPRLRVRQQLTLLDAGDLRFTKGEVREFLNILMQLGLTEAQIQVLGERTEGWIAGLQMASLALQKMADSDTFIERFSGSHRYLTDYLVDEVLRHQPDEMHDFLLKTSLLKRFCASLCDAVLDRADSQAMLEKLERANLFLIPLDDERRWYRYHHLFGELLRSRLNARDEDLEPLHERASVWFKAGGFVPEAVEHSFLADDTGRAAELIAGLDLGELFSRDERDLILGWLDRLPRRLRVANPKLFGWLAASKFATHRLDEIAEHLADDEQVVKTLGLPEDSVEWAMLISMRTTYHYMAGDFKASLAFAEQIKVLKTAHPFLKNAPKVHEGLVLAFLGETHKGLETLLEAREEAERLSFAEMYGVSSYFLAQLYEAQARLSDASSMLELALTRYLELTGAGERSAYYPAKGFFARLLYQHNRLSEAQTELCYVLRSARPLKLRQAVMDGEYYSALSKFALGQKDAVRPHRQNLLACVNPLPDMPIKRRAFAMTARLDLLTGQLGEAASWAASRPIPQGAEMSLAFSFNDFTQARIFIAVNRFEDAETLLTRKLAYAEDKGLAGDALEARMLLALSEYAQDRLEPALTLLGTALKRAEPEGYIRLFVDEGEAMKELLAYAKKRGVFAAYIGKLLDAFEGSGAPQKAASQTGDAVLTEPLSEREREVLSLIAEGLTNKQIAKRLLITAATVKRHSVNIYGKLGVSSRTQAFAKASELGLL